MTASSDLLTVAGAAVVFAAVLAFGPQRLVRLVEGGEPVVLPRSRPPLLLFAALAAAAFSGGALALATGQGTPLIATAGR